jgi:hypothetical protein
VTVLPFENSRLQIEKRSVASCNDSVTSRYFLAEFLPIKMTWDLNPSRVGEFLSIFPANAGLPLHYLHLCDALKVVCAQGLTTHNDRALTFLRFSGAQARSGCVSAQHRNASLLFSFWQLSEIRHERLNVLLKKHSERILLICGLINGSVSRRVYMAWHDRMIHE